MAITGFENLPDLLKSINLRKDANDSLSNATDQYEADVADFKNSQANEFEQGLASLMDRIGALENTPAPSFNMPDLSGFARIEDIPSIDTSQFLTAGDLPTQPTYDDRGLRDRLDMLENQYTTGFDELNNMVTPIDTSQFLTAGDLPSFNVDDYRDDFLSIAREGIDIPEFEQPDLSNFATLDDLPTFDFDEGAFRDNLFEDILENIPQPPQPPAFNEDELRESIYNDIIGDLPGLFEDFDFPIPGIPGKEPFPGDLPPMTPPQNPPFDGFPPTDFPGGTPGFFDQFPGITPPGSGNPYEGIFGPGNGFPPINFPLPPITDPITDPITPPPPVDNTPTGPINPYTGQPISNPYTPYSTESGAAPLNRAITPRAFGQAPGFERPVGGPIVKPIDPPRKLPPKPPSIGGIGGGGRIYLDDEIRLPPPEDIRTLKGGGGISMLPMNGQGDTLTTQVFQSGFRPRR